MDFQNFTQIQIYLQKTFCNSGVILGPTTNLGSISSAVLTFIGYNQTDRQTYKVYIYIEGEQSIIKFVQCNFIYSYFLFIPFSNHDYSFS